MKTLFKFYLLFILTSISFSKEIQNNSKNSLLGEEITAEIIHEENNNSIKNKNKGEDNLHSQDDSNVDYRNLDGTSHNYTLELDFKKSNHVHGDIAIKAKWDNFTINFGKKNNIPRMINTSNFSNIEPPYTLAYPTESGIIHISGLLSNKQISSHSLKVSGGVYEDGIKNYKIKFDEDYLTNPPDLLLVKENKISKEVCDGVIPKGIYLTWQFDIWGGGLSEDCNKQLFSVEATTCPKFYNKTQSSYDSLLVDVDSKVPDDIIKLMTDGKAFSFTKSNSFGATYTIKGTPTK